ncbi:MAG: hypothetical protein ACXAAH_12825 [Promethearchaeota archaeon]|jgi:hypothetical protein
MINFEIADILSKFKLSDRDKKNLSQLFEFTKYLYDNEENLTKTMNLVKKAKDQIIERIQEMFEESLLTGEDNESSGG